MVNRYSEYGKKVNGRLGASMIRIRTTSDGTFITHHYKEIFIHRNSMRRNLPCFQNLMIEILPDPGGIIFDPELSHLVNFNGLHRVILSCSGSYSRDWVSANSSTVVSIVEGSVLA